MVQKHLRVFLNHFFTRKDQIGNDFFTGKFPVFLYGPFCENAFGAARVCAAMKAPVGLLSGRAVCTSRWRGFAPTSSAGRDKRET